MKTRTYVIALLVGLCLTGTGYAMMNGWNGSGGSHMGGIGGNHMEGGRGHGMDGAGGMISGMMGNTIFHGYLDVLNPLETFTEARTAIQVFIDSVNSDLRISEIWEYTAAYKAELSDTDGEKAFDLIADKFTGAVSPEMGLSMMVNASYGKGIYHYSRGTSNMVSFGKNLNVTPDEAKQIAEAFVATNNLSYTLNDPEIYPGYYKFHTSTPAGPGMDIMVNGYNGEIWMDSLLGVPIQKE